jgi:hypothetical protein
MPTELKKAACAEFDRYGHYAASQATFPVYTGIPDGGFQSRHLCIPLR